MSAIPYLGHNHLLEIRLLETGFLSRFPPNLQIRCPVFDVCQKKKIVSKEKEIFRLG